MTSLKKLYGAQLSECTYAEQVCSADIVKRVDTKCSEASSPIDTMAGFAKLARLDFFRTMFQCDASYSMSL